MNSCLLFCWQGAAGDSQQWEFDHKELQYNEKMAEGSFGDVFKGKLWGTRVAIKTLKQLDQTDEAILDDLKQVYSFSFRSSNNMFIFFLSRKCAF